MPEDWKCGSWLLMDAAGPELVTGIIANGEWRIRKSSRLGFLESLKPSVESVLAGSGRELSDLHGCLFAEGPGSTLGLRLAAMFLRGLMSLPDFRHWRCLCYNNLSLACACYARDDRSGPHHLAAPWRRDRFHLVTMNPDPEEPFVLSSADPQYVMEKPVQTVRLGNRHTQLEGLPSPLPYPVESIPETLGRYPGLLREKKQPVPYLAEKDPFTRWSTKRHSVP